MDNADWFKQNLTITANATTSPDGTQNADLLDDGTASGSQHWIYQGPSFSNSIAYTISFYAKYVSRKYMAINIFNGSTSQYVTYDIQNGSVFGSTGDVTASITSVGNGWYRVVYTRTMAASGSPNFRIALADDTGSVTYTGSNKQVYMWGAQLEESSYPTSYIPTTSASATRVADACFKTGISSLIGQSEGTMFFDGYCNGDAEIISINRSVVNSVFLYSAGGFVRAYVYSDSTGLNLLSSVSCLTRFKAAVAYKSNSIAFYVNGTLIAQDTSTTFTPNLAMESFYIAQGGYVQSKEQVNCNESIIFPTRLTNAQLAYLTTL
jgi:hypothetical protein